MRLTACAIELEDDARTAHMTAQKLDLALTVKSISSLCDLFSDSVLLSLRVVVHVSEAGAAG